MFADKDTTPPRLTPRASEHDMPRMFALNHACCSRRSGRRIGLGLFTTPLLALLCLAFVATPAVARSGERDSGRRHTYHDLLIRLADIRDRDEQFLNEDFDQSWQAIEEAMRDENFDRPPLISIVRRWLTQDRQTLQRLTAQLGSPDAVRELEQELHELQRKARENIDALEAGRPLETARQYHRDMLAKWNKLVEHYHVTQQMARILHRRERMLKVWNELQVPNDNFYTPEREAALKTRTEEAMGLSVTELLQMESAAIQGRDARGIGSQPSRDDLPRWYRWHYQMSRAIEQYNRTQATLLDANEHQNLQVLNEYREALGVLPLEVDGRVVQAARRHSKEMVDMGYFSHESPTSERRTFGMRMQLEGYRQPGGENIANGYRDGESAFWGWFYSPGHHQNMTRPGFTAIGIGRWNQMYTQKFGTGPRLMFADSETREQAQRQDDILRPQG